MKTTYSFSIDELPKSYEGKLWNSLCSLVSAQKKEHNEIGVLPTAVQVSLYGEANGYTTLQSLVTVLKAFSFTQAFTSETCLTETSCKFVKTNGNPRVVVNVTVNYPSEKKGRKNDK